MLDTLFVSFIHIKGHLIIGIRCRPVIVILYQYFMTSYSVQCYRNRYAVGALYRNTVISLHRIPIIWITQSKYGKLSVNPCFSIYTIPSYIYWRNLNLRWRRKTATSRMVQTIWHCSAFHMLNFFLQIA